ncbi:hypothetical protein [Opitutus sp. ER46]|uniref:hypothetical protein n=1 Tax=Opitutus sp. ER46 TaxID=2161864 RepID=UPI000D3129B9|nr:hypothetical protein [Opitutus sp. ER46]PTX91655.1 hypothetical protein DB354_17450 [Opitutus sp. ER46]
MITLLALAAALLLVTGIWTRLCNAREFQRGLRLFRQGDQRPALPILLPAFGRPQYLRAVLDSLSRVEGIDQTVLVLSQDGSNPEVAALIRDVKFTRVIALRHTRPFCGLLCQIWDGTHAVSTHIHFLLRFALEGMQAPAAIVVEDDIVVSPDFLRFFEWCLTHVLADDRVLSVSTFNLHSRPDPATGYDPRAHPYALIRNTRDGQDAFPGWGWAITRRQWLRVRATWSFLNWDLKLDETQRQLGLRCYKPALARSRTIGMQGGVNFTELENNPKWAGILLNDEPLAYAAAPALHEADLATPPCVDLKPAAPLPNGLSRNRARRLTLLAAAAVIIVLEAYCGYGWF